jgi:hypothetical protein
LGQYTNLLCPDLSVAGVLFVMTRLAHPDNFKRLFVVWVVPVFSGPSANSTRGGIFVDALEFPIEAGI